MPAIPTTWKEYIRRSQSEARPDKNLLHSIRKETKRKNGWSVSQVVEDLPSKHEGLNSHLSITIIRK
jgi:hypothetical protein